MRLLSFCCGIGALDIILEDAEHIAHSDINDDVNDFYMERFPESEELGDFTKLESIDDWRPDVITAGLPCQPISLSGSRKYDEDERYLFDEFVSLLDRSSYRPVLLFENVAHFMNPNLKDMRDRFFNGLDRLGYNYQTRVTAASDGGAPHQRRRFFAAAWQRGKANTFHAQAAFIQFKEQYLEPFKDFGNHPPRQLFPTPLASDAMRRYMGTGFPPSITMVGIFCPPSTDVTKATLEELARSLPEQRALWNIANGKQFLGRREWGPYQKAVDLWSDLLDTDPPNKVTVYDEQTKGQFLNAEIAEWIMGFKEGYVTDRQAKNRVNLRLLGNSVVPQQAAHALKWCLHQQEEGTLFS